MTDIRPREAPSARGYLLQQLERFQTAVRERRSIKELRCDLILVSAGVDDLEDESTKDAAA